MIALLLMSNLIKCSPDLLLCRTRRFKGIPAAVSYIHASLPPETPLEDKCKRYAVILSHCSGTTVPHEADAMRVSTLDNTQLDREFQQIPTEKLMESYMCAIEGYRIRQLEPPFLELIECLDQVDSSEAMTYLENAELIMISDLYKLVLESPETKINLDCMDLSTFRPTFRANLENLFHANIDPACERTASFLAPNIIDPIDISDSVGAKSPDQQQLLRLQKQRTQERHLFRCRERARLTQQRLRILRPEEMREKSRTRQRQLRERLKSVNDTSNPTSQQERSTFSAPVAAHVPRPMVAPKPILPDAPNTERECRKQRQRLRRQQLFPDRWQRFVAQLQSERDRQEENLRFLRQHNYIQQQRQKRQQLERQPQPNQVGSNTPDPVSQYLSADYLQFQEMQASPQWDPATPSLAAQEISSPSLPCQAYNYLMRGDSNIENVQFDQYMANLLAESESDLGLFRDLMRSPSQSDGGMFARLSPDQLDAESSKPTMSEPNQGR